jgi:tape measure domain-containing protein
MANTLMFEVGVNKAIDGLNDLKNELDQFVTDYTKKMQIQVEIKNLETFINSLKSIGNGDQLKPLLDRIEILQRRLSSMSSEGQYFDNLRREAAEAAKAVEIAEKQLEAMKKTGNSTFISNARLDLLNAQKNQAGAAEALASATERMKKEGEQLASTSKATVVATEQNKSAFENESTAAQEAVDKLNKLVTEKQQVVDAERKLAESSKTGGQTLKEEADNADKTAQSIKSVGKAQKDAADASKKAEKEQAGTVDNLAIKYQTLIARIENWQSSLSKLLAGGDSKYFGAQLNNAIEAYGRALRSAQLGSVFDESGEHLKTLRSVLQLLGAEFANVNREAKAFNREQEKAANSAWKAHVKDNVAASKAQSNEYKAMQKNAQDARQEAEKMLAAREKMLRSQSESLSKIMSGGRGKLDTYQYDQVRDALRAIRQELREIETAKQRGGLSTGALLSLGGGANDYAAIIAAYRKFISEKHEATSANSKLSTSEQQLANSIKGTTDSMKGQSQVLSDLKSMAMQYLSVWGASNFINNIIELGGQLEQQRLSIGAILQDTAQANHLFGQIKDLAIKSPFGVQQLDAMTKQLSAYGFQYSELYEWTKRLADISAATGTSVDRLALALGHVRSEGALSGYTLRQFSMGNIPLLQKLSENLGKTKQEIRKMTRNKEIGYEDVLNVLKQLTDESGMFYQAQETMAGALNAKFKNLRDSFQIMYSEMAEGAPGDFLKKVAVVLTDISKSWRVLMPLVLAGGTAFGVWKLATMALNHELERNGRALAGNAISTSKYSVAQLRAIATTGRFTLALKGLGRALMSIGRFIFSPVTLGFAAVEGLIYLWSKHNDEVRRAKELAEQYKETAKESQKNIGNQLENIPAYNGKMTDSEMKTGIEAMTEAIKNYGVNGQKVINDMINSSMSLAEKYQYLREELEKTAKVYKEMEKTSGAFEYGINQSDGGWFDENVETNLTDYAKSFNDFVDDVTTYNSQYGNSIEKAIKNAENSDLVFREATKNMTSYGEKLAEFWSNPEKYQNAAKFMNSLFGSGAGSQDALDINESFFGYLKDKNRALKDLDEFFDATESKLKEKGYDFTEQGENLTETQVGNLLKQSKDWLEKHPEWENIYSVIWDKLNQRWGLPIEPDVTPVEEKLPEWMQAIQDELDVSKTGIQIKSTMSMEQIIEEARKAYQTAETTINKLGPIAIKAGIKIEGLTDENIEKYGPTSENYNPELYNTLLELKKGQDAKRLIDTFGKKRGVNFSGMKKDGSHKAEKQSQEAAKAVREEIRIMKEAADAFQYWREKVGDGAAWAHVEAEFGDVLARIGITAKNVNDLRSNIEGLTPKIQKIKDKKVQNETFKEQKKELAQLDRKDFEKTADEFASKVQIELDGLTRAWEIFNSVREATGNVELAVQISGADYANGKTRNLADALREKIQKDFDAAGGGIAFDMNLSDKDIDESIKRSMPAASQEQIKGLVDEYKKWRDLQRDVLKNDIDVFAKLVGGAKDYDSQIQKINDDYKKQIEALDEVANRNPEKKQEVEKAKGAATAQAEYDKWKLSTQYINLMNNSLSMTRDEVENGINIGLQRLNDLMMNNRISAQEYAQEMEKIRNIQSEWTKNSFFGKSSAWGAGIMGGLSGRKEYYKSQARDAYAEVAKLEQKKSKYGLYGLEDKQLSDARKKAKQAESNAEYTGEIENILNSFDALAKAMDPVINLFEELGMTGIANVLSAGQSALSQAATMGTGAEMLFKGAGPYGAAIGAGLSLVSSLFGGFDDALQAEIEASKQRQKEMENMSKNLETALDRALAGVYGVGETAQGQKAMEDFNKSVDKYREEIRAREEYETKKAQAESEIEKAKQSGDTFALRAAQIKLADAEFSEKRRNWGGGMSYLSPEAIDDIRKAVETGKYYDMQRASMSLQRDELKHQIESEKDKKDTDWGAVSDMEQQIKELDDQWRNFAKDMMKALYEIDVKDWASQFGDALYDAWKQGEDGAKAFKKKASEIIGNIAKNILVQRVIGDALQPVEDAIIEMMDKTSGELNEEDFAANVGSMLTESIGKIVPVMESTLNAVDEAVQKSGLPSLKENADSSLSGNIKGITENTADLLASYLNAIRADVSVNRMELINIRENYLKDIKTQMISASMSLGRIESHTQAIMKSNEAICNSLSGMISDLKNGNWRVPVS